MKIYRLTTATHAPDANQRAVPLDVLLRQVGAATGSDADRQQSLREQLAEVEENAVGPFMGEDLIHQNAQAVAASILDLGPRAAQLVKRQSLVWQYRPINVRA